MAYDSTNEEKKSGGKIDPYIQLHTFDKRAPGNLALA